MGKPRYQPRISLGRKTRRTSGKGLVPVRRNTARANTNWNKLVRYLMANRAHDRCEIQAAAECHERSHRPDWRGLSGHHPIKRSQGRIDTAGNILIACGDCHNHQRYGTGTPLSRDEQLILANKLNKQYKIKGDLDGSHL